MKYYFNKQNCPKCLWLKEQCDLQMHGVKVLDVETIEGLATLAWFELVALAETALPILLVTDKYDNEVERITGAVKIKRFLMR